MIAAAQKKAAEIGQPMSIADAGGNLVAHVRMDDAWIGSIDISIKRAYTARALDISTKDLRLATGQTPVLRYNRQLMQAILHDRLPIAKIVNATVIALDDAPDSYQQFDKGAAKKFVIDPHGVVTPAAQGGPRIRRPAVGSHGLPRTPSECGRCL